MFSTEQYKYQQLAVVHYLHMDTPMSKQSAAPVSSTSHRRRKLIITAVVFVLVLLVGGYYYATRMMDSSSLSEAERQAIMDRIIAESAEGGLSEDTRSAIVEGMEKEQKKAPGITEEQRQALINSMQAESAQ